MKKPSTKLPSKNQKHATPAPKIVPIKKGTYQKGIAQQMKRIKKGMM